MTDTSGSGGAPPPEDAETPEQRALREQIEAADAVREAMPDAPPAVPTAAEIEDVMERLKAMAPFGVEKPPAGEFVSRLSVEDFATLAALGYHDAHSLDRLEVEMRDFLRNERHYSAAQAALFKATALRREISRLNHRWRPRGGNVQQVAFPQHRRANGHDNDSPFLAPGSYTQAALVEAFNKSYVTARLASKSTVVERLPDNTLRYFTYKEFEDHYADVKVLIPTRQGDIEKDGPRWWIESGQAKTYREGVDCVPRMMTSKNVLNTWRGFGPQLEGFKGYDLPDDLKALLADGKGGRGSVTMPRPKGSWRRFRRLVLDVICDGDVELYRWTINWLANMVQKPHMPGQTFLVLQGEEGVGKGVFGDMFTALLGKAHGFYVSSTEGLTGGPSGYNDHLQDKVALFADEAVFSGSRKTDNALKPLVTQDVISVHRKFYSRYTVKNLLHIVMATNSDWAIRVSTSSRRPTVYKVSSRRINDRAYFGAITKQMRQDGGLECMLFDLLVRDISGFDVRKNYHTRAMSEQREFSWEPHHKWLEEVLERRYVWQPKGDHPEFEVWRNVVSRTLLYASYESYYRLHGGRNEGPMYSQRKLSTWLLGLGFSDGRAKSTDPVGERPVEGGATTVILCGYDNRRGIDLGTCISARAVFDTKIRLVPHSEALWASDARSAPERPVNEEGQLGLDVRPPEPPDEVEPEAIPE